MNKDNKYSLLEEKQKLYFNVSLDDIENEVDLDKKYFVLKQLPTHDNEFWDHLENKDYSSISKLKLNKKLLNNFNLALFNNDDDYLEYLLNKRPIIRSKSLSKVNNIINLDEIILRKLNINITTYLTFGLFKKMINKHIYDNNLQKDTNIIMDDILQFIINYNNKNAYDVGHSVNIFIFHEHLYDFTQSSYL